MANEDLGSMIVRVGLDGTDFDKGAKNLNAKMKLAQSELKASASSFENFGKSVDGLKAKQDGLSKIYELQGTKVKQLRKQYDDLVATQGENSAAALKVAKSLNYEIASYNKMGKQLDSVKSELQGLNTELKHHETGWEKAEKSLKSFSDRAGKTGQSMQDIGQTLTMGVTAPLLGLGAVALKSADDFQKSQGKIQASLNLTKEEAKSMSDTAKDIWKDGFGDNIEEVSQALIKAEQNMGAFGWASKKELKEIGKSAIVLSKTFDADINDTTKTANMLITQFGLDSKQAFDMLTWGFQNGLDYSGEFLDSVNEYSPQFSAMGMSAEEMFATFEAGAISGAFNLDKVGDAVKEFNIRIKDGSKTTSDAMGLLSKDTQGVWKEFSKGEATGKEVMDAIVDELSKMDDQVKANQIGVGVFGTQWEDLETDVVYAMGNVNSELVGIEGSTAKAGKALQDNLGDRVRKDLRELGASLLPLGNILLDVVDPAIESTSEHIKEFTEWMEGLSPAAQKTVVAVTGIVAAIGPLLMGLGFAASGIGVVSGALTLLTGPIGLTLLALAGLGLGFAALDKQMDKPIIKADIFKGKISDATKEAVGSYMKLDEDATAELNSLAWSQATITQAMSDDMVAKYRQMGDQVLTAMKENHTKQLEEQQSLFDRSSILTEEEEAKRLAKLKADQLKEVEAHNAKEARIIEIWTTASTEKRGITDAEAQEIALLQEQMRVKAVEELSASQLEQETILRNLKNNKSIIEAETSANTVNKSIETRDKVINDANKQYNDTVSYAESARDELGIISADEAKKIIGEAELKKNQVVAKAEDMHTNVISEAQAQAGEHVGEVNWETGEVLSGWDSMYNGVVDAVNWIRGLFGKGEVDKKGTVKENGRQKQKRQNARISAHANGTPNGSYASGLSMVSEEGRELIHEPGVGTYLSGSNGPELRNFRPGTSVLPNKHTERLLRNYGFPGYANGIGDYFDDLLKGSSHMWDIVKDKFSLKDSLIPSWLNSHTGSPLSYFGDMAKSSIQSMIDGMAGSIGGGSYQGGAGSAIARQAISQALAMLGKSQAFLPGLMQVAFHESGYNPRAINNWDINAQRGDPSVGLFQIINSTFQRWKYPGTNDRTNPLHSALAAIRYLDGRYGGIQNHPGLRSMGSGGGYRPYAKGGEINYKQMALLGENGWKEWVLTSEPQYRQRNLSMWAEAGQAMGVPSLPAIPTVNHQSSSNGAQNLMSGLIDQVNNLLTNINIQTSNVYLDDKLVGEITFRSVDSNQVSALNWENSLRGVKG